MFEELRFYLQETPDMALVLALLGIMVLLALAISLTRSVRRRVALKIAETPLGKRVGGWYRENPEKIARGVAVLCFLGVAVLLVNPLRLLVYGVSGEGIVTSVVESNYTDSDGKQRERSTATIRFEAGGVVLELRDSRSREIGGGFCVAGCERHYKGDRVKVLYFAADPHGARIDSFIGLFGPALVAAIPGFMALIFWRILKPDRVARQTPG